MAESALADNPLVIMNKLSDLCKDGKQERMEDMDKLKKRLIRNGLPTKELEKLSAKYKAEMKALVEEFVEKFGRKV